MTLTEEQKKGQNVLFSIITEAWENNDFKKALITNPEETLEDFFGRSLPSGKKIIVTDQSNPGYLYINIPIKPQQKDMELDEIKLDNVKGGISDGYIVTDYQGLYDSLRKMYK
jgi:hypothetical protein